MIWQPRWLKWSVAISRKGALTRDGIPTTQALTEDVAAGLPGAPMAIPSPGHTGGHCSFVVDGVLVSGDALVTGHPLLSRDGPAAAAEAVQPRPGRAACAAWPRWRCSTPRCCCPATARCGAARSVKPPRKPQRRRTPARRGCRSRTGRSRSGTGRRRRTMVGIRIMLSSSSSSSTSPSKRRTAPARRRSCGRSAPCARTDLVSRRRPMKTRDATPMTSVSPAAARSSHPTVVCERTHPPPVSCDSLRASL